MRENSMVLKIFLMAIMLLGFSMSAFAVEVVVFLTLDEAPAQGASVTITQGGIPNTLLADEEGKAGPFQLNPGRIKIEATYRARKFNSLRSLSDNAKSAVCRVGFRKGRRTVFTANENAKISPDAPIVSGSGCSCTIDIKPVRFWDSYNIIDNATGELVSSKLNGSRKTGRSTVELQPGNYTVQVFVGGALNTEKKFMVDLNDQRKTISIRSRRSPAPFSGGGM